nr:thioredoxin [Dictyostelium discoideum]
MSKVIHVTSNEELDKYLQHQRVVVDFSAEWCGPCRAIAPVFDKLSNEFTTFTFVHVDIDKVNTHPIGKEIRSVPTFYFYVNGAKVSEFSGANEATLRSTLEANI